MHNRATNNKKFSDSTIGAVWDKRTKHVWGEDWGRDKFGNLIKFSEYGNVKHKYGWDIDHSNPKSKGDTDNLINLQPLQSYYNRYVKIDNYPWGLIQHLKSFAELPDNLELS